MPIDPGGLATDCERFAFYHIDNEGDVCIICFSFPLVESPANSPPSFFHERSYFDLKARTTKDGIDYKDVANLLAFIFYEVSISTQYNRLDFFYCMIYVENKLTFPN